MLEHNLSIHTCGPQVKLHDWCKNGTWLYSYTRGHAVM